MRNRSPLPSLLELAALVLLIDSYVWVWKDSFPGDEVAVNLLVLALWIAGHRRRGDTLRGAGFRLDNLWAAFSQVVVFVGPLYVVAILAGLALGSLHFPAASTWPRTIAFLVVWGLMQQYALQAFVYPRLSDAVASPAWAIVAAGLVFGLLHLPNPFLVAVTVGTGMLACWLFRRVPNVLALGVAHGLLSFTLYHALPRWLNGGMRIGPPYWAR